MSEVQLRSFVYLNKIQPQFAAFVAKSCRADVPTAGMASLFVEVQPGIEINKVADIAMKKTAVRPAIEIEEREYGIIEFHHESQEEIRYAGSGVLEELELDFTDRIEPKILSRQIIDYVTPYHAQVINNDYDGNLLLAGESLLIVEIQPAVNIVRLVNEAEKATGIKLVHFRLRGRFGRLYLAGSEDQTRAALNAVNNSYEELRLSTHF